MKRSLFKRIFILYGVILVLSILVTEEYITREVRQNTINTMRDNLSVQAALMSGTIPFQSPSPIDGICTRLKEQIHARVTVIALNGRIVGDSDSDSVHMANHGDRIEVQQAKLSGLGMTIRHSDTLGYDFLYVAKLITNQGFIRLSVPLKDVDASINLVRMRIILVVGIVLLAAGTMSFWQTDRIRRLTNQIRGFSSALARGDVGKQLFLSRAGEFNDIAGSLNSMSAELKKSITASEEEKHRLNVILRSIPDALFIIDADGTILLSSLAARKTFGETALQGRPFIEVLRNSEFLSLMEDVRKQRKAGIAEFRIDSPLEQYCIVHVSPLSYKESELSGFVAVFHDITQLKKLEQTRKDFVANISHEIKTPITAIMGFAETLLEGAIEDKDHAVMFLETIRANSRRINSLVDDLMTISKIELGVIKVEKTSLDAGNVMEQVVATLGEKASGKGLAFTLAIAPHLSGIRADPDKLFQILTNLADNAIKFTEKGTVTLGVTTVEGKTCLFVEDTGIGISKKHLSRIGERFYRVDPGRSRTMGGTGLGLAIVKHLVKAHGWDLQINSEPGKGTRINILIP
jgi:two-component system phosphate regulon sensor histidine kinase PhoR